MIVILLTWIGFSRLLDKYKRKIINMVLVYNTDDLRDKGNGPLNFGSMFPQVINKVSVSNH